MPEKREGTGVYCHFVLRSSYGFWIQALQGIAGLGLLRGGHFGFWAHKVLKVLKVYSRRAHHRTTKLGGGGILGALCAVTDS